jgi:hypothetical protein
MKEQDLIRYLKRFYSSSGEVENVIKEYLSENPDADNARIFNELAYKKGTGKSHHQYRDGQLRPFTGGKFKHRKGRH